MHSPQWRKPLAIATSLVAALALAACGTGEESSSGDEQATGGVKAGPGVDTANKAITVTFISALSGPVAAAIGNPATAGTKDYVEQLNAAGGIDGWTIDLKTADGAYDPTKHVQQFQAVKGESALIQSIGSPTTKAALQLIEQEGVVTIPMSWDTDWAKHAILAPVGTPNSVDMANLVDYVVNDHGAQGKKFGILYQNDEYGLDGKRGYDTAVKALGLDDVEQVTYKSGDSDFTAQAQKLKAAGAEVVMLAATASASAPFVGTAASLGYSPTYLMEGGAFAEAIMTEGGDPEGKKTPVADALANDTYLAAYAPPWDPEAGAGMQQMLDNVSPDQTPATFYTVGYAQAKVIEGILRKAIESGDLTREGILTAKNSAGEVDMGGLAPNPTYSDSTEIASRKSTIAKIDQSQKNFLELLELEYEGESQKGI